MNTFVELAVNYGTTHFVSVEDFLVRGLFLPALFVFSVWGFIKTYKDLKDLDYEECCTDEETGDPVSVIIETKATEDDVEPNHVA